VVGPSSESEPGSISDDEAKRRVAEVFSRLAPAYGSNFDFFGEKLVELTGVKPGMRVLDVAAGRGASAHPARALGAEVVAVDLAEGMVDALVADGFDARVMDAEHLDFPDHSFDAVLNGFGLFFLPDPVQGARELRRVVKPGGPVACSMPLVTFPPYVYELRKEFGPKAPGPDIPGPSPDFDGAGILAAAGFERVDTVDYVQETTFESGEHMWEFLLSTGVRTLLERLGPEDGAELQHRVITGAGEGPVVVPMSARYWITSG
jgi:SAM-dependent methyltransferase